jgi:hypothetical protein
MSEAKFMVDRVAEAIARVAVTQKTPNFHFQAIAAIEAMREPTDAMCDAADWQQQSEVDQYQRAIDAALGKVDA